MSTEATPGDIIYFDEPITKRMHAESFAAFLAAKGYRRVSKRFGILARIDREDWREFMAQKHAPWDPAGEGMGWASSDGMEDFYRRVHSKDTRTVSSAIARLVPTSTHDPIGFVAPVGVSSPTPFHADNTSWFKETP